MLPNLKLELAEAKEMQKSYLPSEIKNRYLSVKSIYSPFSHVSGDCLNYWWEDSKKTLYGYIFDVTGHSLASAMQISVIRMLFYQASKKALSVSEALEYVNRELVLDKHPKTLAVAIMFSLNPAKKVLEYSSAGISPFYIFGEKQDLIKTSGYPLGYKKNATYQLNKRSIEGAKLLVFASDGFTELYDSKIPVDGMHDDCSAILINPSGGEFLWIPAELPSWYHFYLSTLKNRDSKGET